MNYLQICQEVNNLVGLQGTFSSASAATGMQATLAQMVKSAWIDIQAYRKDWHFMRSSLTFNTVENTCEYSRATILGGATDTIANWVPGMILYTDSDSYDTPLREVSYDYYVRYDYTEADASLPQIFAQDPVDKHLWINKPSGAYTITCHFISYPVDLTNNTDIPTLPIELHRAIVYRAAADMAAFLGNINGYQVYQQKADQMLGSVLRAENPGLKVRLPRLI